MNNLQRRLAVTGLAVALAACGSQSDAKPADAPDRQAAPSSTAPADLSRQDRAAVMRAAGFFAPQPDDYWSWRDPEDAETVCDRAFAAIAEARDLNGDGQAEAVIRSDSDVCFGFNQRRVDIYTPTSQGWKPITWFQDVFVTYSFYPRDGIAWPDIEIASGQATGCVRFLRWNGSAYIDGGSSAQGDICELTDEGRAASSASTPATGTVAFPPLEKGYYVTRASCAQAVADETLLTYFDERRIASFDGAQPIEGFESLGDGRYRVKAVAPDEAGRMSRADFVIAVDGRAGFTNVEFGDRYTHCPTEQIPRSTRQEWGDLSRR